jgi:hypothetical protein
VRLYGTDPLDDNPIYSYGPDRLTPRHTANIKAWREQAAKRGNLAALIAMQALEIQHSAERAGLR